MMYIEKKCPFCLDLSVVECDQTEYMAWQKGMVIQDAMPFTSAEKRETLISGMCYSCQKMLFGFDNDGAIDWNIEPNF